MTEKNYENRHIFLAISVLIPIFGPISLLFLPQTIANIAHYGTGDWYVFSPGENLVVYSTSFVLFFISSMILFFFDIKRVSITISSILTCTGILSLLAASQSYQTLSENSISYSPLISLTHYSYNWEEVKMITLTHDQDDDITFLTFHFTDGNQMKLESNKYLWAIQNKLNKKLKEMNLSIEKQ